MEVLSRKGKERRSFPRPSRQEASKGQATGESLNELREFTQLLQHPWEDVPRETSPSRDSEEWFFGWDSVTAWVPIRAEMNLAEYLVAELSPDRFRRLQPKRLELIRRPAPWVFCSGLTLARGLRDQEPPAHP
jgi:hypothetical protein